jgi:hypothetical protein
VRLDRLGTILRRAGEGCADSHAMILAIRPAWTPPGSVPPLKVAA